MAGPDCPLPGPPSRGFIARPQLTVCAGGGAEALALGGDPWQMTKGGRRLVQRVEELEVGLCLE